MPKSQRFNKSLSRKARLTRRLAAYSLAAGAAVTAAEQTQGAILHTNLNAVVNTGGSYSFGVSGNEFTLTVPSNYNLNFKSQGPGYVYSSGSWGAEVKINGNGGNGIAEEPFFTKGQKIGYDYYAGVYTSFNNEKRVANRSFWWYNSNGNIDITKNETNDFPSGNTKYLGLEFKSGGDSYYGWLRLSIAKNPASDPTTPGQAAGFTVSLLDFAYNNVAGALIEAGQGEGSTVPEPGTLGMLALGAVGLLAWKACQRRKNDRESVAQRG